MIGTAAARATVTTDEDHVILLDPDGTTSGLAPRASVHSTHTPLHLAFSCHLVREDGAVLLTRRSLAKRTWPGVWTNAFCGHPRRGESFEDAISRHARDELGLEVRDIRSVLPDFRYRAVDASGIVENEKCPVFTARPLTDAAPNPAEVMELRWVAADDLEALVRLAPWTLSPWSVEQLEQFGGRLAHSPGGSS